MEIRRDMFAIVTYRIYEVVKTDEELLVVLFLLKGQGDRLLFHGYSR